MISGNNGKHARQITLHCLMTRRSCAAEFNTTFTAIHIDTHSRHRVAPILHNSIICLGPDKERAYILKGLA